MLPRLFFSEHFSALVFAVMVIAYFYFQPRVEFVVSLAFCAFWIFGYFCDAWITIKNSPHIQRHEVNVIFAALYSRLGARSCLVQFLIEAVIVVVAPVFFIGRLEVSASSVVAVVFGASHLLAFYSNRKFVCGRE
jgi:hypothetical protein